MKLRNHQEKALKLARESFAKGNNHICLCACVASGKTLIAKTMIEGALEKGIKVGFMSSRVVLIQQLKKYFKDMPNITIGTLQYWSRRDIELDFIIFDEIDFHGSKSKNKIKCKKSITLSGTPTDSNGNILEFDDVLDIIQIPDLIELKLAKPIRVLSTALVDTSNLKKQNGDFHKKQSFELMDKASVKKDLISVYNQYAKDRITILFAIDTTHAEILKDEFLKAGIKCDTTHSKKSDEAKKAFERGEINLLINVMQLTTGYDYPPINCVMFARPCSSLPLFIQCVGRGIRLNPDKPNDECLVIDCSEVIKRVNHHPLQRINLNQKKTQQKSDLCQCGGNLTTIEKEIIPIDSLSCTLRTIKQCNTCKNVIEDEQIKVINILQCKNCLQPIDRNISMQIKDKKIEFTYECGNCGEFETVREVILTENELKEIEYTERMQRGDWVTVREMLKDSCRRCQYNWKYSERLLEYLQQSNKTIEESIEAIKDIDSKGHKISRIMYGYFD